MSSAVKAAVLTAVAAWNAGDTDGFLSLFDPSLSHHGLAPEPLDVSGNRAFYEQLRHDVPGCQLVIEDLLAEDDRVAVRFRLVGEHTGGPISVDAQTMMRFEGGRVVERWTIVADLNRTTA